MKTKDFIQKVEEDLGYVTDKSENYITIRKRQGKFDKLFAMVAINKVLGIDTSFHNFTSHDKHERDSLFNLILEYARTPLEEREEEKKYVYKFPFSITMTNTTHHIIKFDSGIRLDGSINSYVNNSQPFHFTDKEVEQYSGKARLLFDACEKIEVKP